MHCLRQLARAALLPCLLFLSAAHAGEVRIAWPSEVFAMLLGEGAAQ